MCEEELNKIFNRDLDNIGNFFDDRYSNTFKYQKNEKYIHFFKSKKNCEHVKDFEGYMDGKKYFMKHLKTLLINMFLQHLLEEYLLKKQC